MPREDWRDLEAERMRRLRDRDLDRDLDRDRDYDRDRSDARAADTDDYGQADYSDLYGYDPVNRTGYRAYDDGRREPDARRLDERRLDERRSYDETRRYGDDERRRLADLRDRRDARDYDADRHRARRDGPSDRVLWAVIMERLDDERRIDTRDVEVDVRDAEVTLNGTVRHKADKRRIEDIADIDGIRHVQNNLRVRESRRWVFF